MNRLADRRRAAVRRCKRNVESDGPLLRRAGQSFVKAWAKSAQVYALVCLERAGWDTLY
jgi:hypothetical protein